MTINDGVWPRRARRWDGSSSRGPGRPRIAGRIGSLRVRMASENRTWGYKRIQGALANLGHYVCKETVKRILKRDGIEPAPERSRKTTWNEFIRIHWDSLATAGILCVKLPPKSPNLNAFAERFVRSIKSECLDRMIFFGGKHLRCVVNEYVENYHAERKPSGHWKPPH